ncbi:WhiB family transcriptional regulator, partial [Streptomyces sp. NPDC095614]|uniref:WhiB family transcriptional regulator n=1 Tax=Streptomyces sp. NPDC095614 TaxID=3156692 RepID=UPI0033330A41
QCLDWALENGQDSGVWGGMDENERRALKRRRTGPAPPPGRFRRVTGSAAGWCSRRPP